MFIRRFALVLLWLFLPAVLSAAEKPKIPVYVLDVTGPANTGGFVPAASSQLADSVADLRKHLAGNRKHIRPAKNSQEAKVVIEVLSRRMEADDEIHVLTVKLIATEYAEEITVKDDSTYRNCALAIMKKVDAFVAANRERLR